MPEDTQVKPEDNKALDRFLNNAIHRALTGTIEQLVDACKEYPTLINKPNLSGLTPLMAVVDTKAMGGYSIRQSPGCAGASMDSHPGVELNDEDAVIERMKVLIRYGADVNLKIFSGGHTQSALREAESRNKLRIVDFLNAEIAKSQPPEVAASTPSSPAAFFERQQKHDPAAPASSSSSAAP